jgi:NADP-dependent 3-hydroxy acid dehydrogenase YdfG
MGRMLSDNVAVMTGATSGIGETIAVSERADFVFNALGE